MTIAELEQRVMELRSRPLVLLCRDPKGKEQVMSVRECMATGSVYIHITADELDELLSAELGERTKRPADGP